MRIQLKGYGLLALSFILFVLCGASFIAMLQSFTVTSTISAVESAFGTMVITIILLAMGKKAYTNGKKYLKSNS